MSRVTFWDWFVSKAIPVIVSMERVSALPMEYGWGKRAVGLETAEVLQLLATTGNFVQEKLAVAATVTARALVTTGYQLVSSPMGFSSLQTQRKKCSY